MLWSSHDVAILIALEFKLIEALFLLNSSSNTVSSPTIKFTASAMPPRNKSPKSGKGLASIFHLVRKVHISGGQFTVISPDVEEVEVDMDPDPGMSLR